MTKSSPVRVRFAPSPTGYLHVGGVRTALFNWLFARNKKGTFILRIEDTDKKRSTKESLTDILDTLKWLGLSWDEGPSFQSEQLEKYVEYADKLIAEGKAYKSDRPRKIVDGAGEEEAASGAEVTSGEVTIFKSTHEKVVLEDLVHGTIEFDTQLIDDFIILKSDGMPTYNFACVVDDALMKITHVIRGDDHISNTPKQIMLYQALGFSLPQFAHVPMILGPDGARLSKRHGATAHGRASEYRRQGYLAGALRNFLVLLGWSPGEDKELLPLAETIRRFSLKRITGKSAVFNSEKLTWMNGMYISMLSDEEMVNYCRPFMEEAGLLKGPAADQRLPLIVPLFKKRIKVLTEIVGATEYFFQEKIDFDAAAREKFLKADGAVAILEKTKAGLEGLADFEKAALEKVLQSILTELGLKTKILMQTLRVAISGRTATPGIFETIIGMGKELTLKHIEQALALARENS